MLETQVQLKTEKPGLSGKLRKDEFNSKYRFREARNEGLVNCASCTSMSGVPNGPGVSHCSNPFRFRKVKLTQRLFNEHSKASERVCDNYTSKPLPLGVAIPELPPQHVILLGTQRHDPYHADPNCPYVLEELRMKAENEKSAADIGIFDISDLVPGESIRDKCEMPCCESRLPFQIYMGEYRRHVGIKPDGTEPMVWVRNGIVKHEKKAEMTPEQAEQFFNLTEVVAQLKSVHDKIGAVSDYMHDKCNWLGSRPLAEAVNPVGFSNRHHFRDEQTSPLALAYPDYFWAYDERLFDRNTKLEVPMLGLENIPEGFLLCADTKGVLRHARSHCRESSLLNFWAYGILKPMQDQTLLSKGASYFLDVREVKYHASNSMWGEFGIGFGAVASFDQE